MLLGFLVQVSGVVEEVSHMLIEERGAGKHGIGSASGAAQRNTCMLKRERESAIII